MNDNPSGIDEAVIEALRLEREGRPEEALNCLGQSSITDPYILSWAGQLARKLGRLEAAERFFADAVALSPKNGVALAGMGLVSQDVGDIPSARDFFLRALEIETKASTLVFLGVAQGELGNIVEARLCYQNAILVDPAYGEAYFNLAVTFRAEQPNKAIELFSKALELDPDYAAAHRELGFSLRRVGDFANAVHHINRAIQLDKNDGWAYIYLGNLRWAMQQATQSEEAFRKAIEIWPELSVPRWCLAYLLERQGRKYEARSLYEQSLDLDPDDFIANRRLGLFLMECGETERAKDFIARAEALERENATRHSLLPGIDWE